MGQNASSQQTRRESVLRNQTRLHQKAVKQMREEERKANAFNLKELVAQQGDDPVLKDRDKMELYRHIINMQFEAENHVHGDFPLYKQYVKADSNKHKVNRPQWIVEYSPNSESLIIWIYGTQNEWDWKNLLNMAPIALDWRDENNVEHTIQVHSGIYKAVNTWAFYDQLIKAINSIAKELAYRSKGRGRGRPKRIERIIFSGHSQGGAIAELMFFILKGKIKNCAFYREFSEYSCFHRKEMPSMSVVAFGSFSPIDHASARIMDRQYHRDITKFVEAKDAAVISLTGTSNTKPRNIQYNRKRGSGSAAFIHAFVEHALQVKYYGAIGTYHAIIRTKTKSKTKQMSSKAKSQTKAKAKKKTKVKEITKAKKKTNPKNKPETNILRVLNQYDGGIGERHLRYGARTVLDVGISQFSRLRKTKNNHVYDVYHKDFDLVFKDQIAKRAKSKSFR